MNIQKNYKLRHRDEWAFIVQRVTKKEPIYITFQVTENCCMACTYCYQNHKTISSMDFDIAKRTIDQLFDDPITFETPWIFDFIGGEPLMEIKLIDQICTYTLNRLIETHSNWIPYFRCSICSNGLLYFNKDVQLFFKKFKNFISYTISIDGNQELHDSCRIDLCGNGTYDRIIKAINHYRQNYGILEDTKMTLSPSNVKYTSSALINLINENYKYIYCNCIFEEGWDINHAKILYNELKIVADYILENDLYDKVYIRFFDEDLYCPMDEDDNNNWCGGVLKNKSPNYYAVDYQGKKYPCIRYMESSLNGEQPPLSIGNVFTSEPNNIEKENIQLLSNITRRSQSTDECFYCPIAKGCAWCSGYNYQKFGTPNKRATYICYMHKAQSLANVYYWNKLYQKLNIDKKLKIYLPKEESLKIINEKELKYLLNL